MSTYTLPDHVKIVGLFCEPSWHIPICSLGVVAEPQQPLPSSSSSSSNAPFPSLLHSEPVPVPDSPELPEFASHWVEDCYLSKARLRGAKTLSLQRPGKRTRCTGLLIEYEDGRSSGRAAEVLGQWDPAAADDEDTTSVIYDARRDGPLKAVYFVYRGFENPNGRIEDVCVEAPEVNDDDDPGVAYFEWTRLDEVCRRLTVHQLPPIFHTWD